MPEFSRFKLEVGQLFWDGGSMTYRFFSHVQRTAVCTRDTSGYLYSERTKHTVCDDEEEQLCTSMHRPRTNSHGIFCDSAGRRTRLRERCCASFTSEKMSTSDATITNILRFVPQGTASLLDDAPGWEDSDGPTCWKCKGAGTINKQRTKKRLVSACEKMSALDDPPRACPICLGRGHLLKRRIPNDPGKITRGRKRPHPDEGRLLKCGPDPAAIATNDVWSKLVLKANKEYVDVTISEEDHHTGPEWLPREGEELCNLVGYWRILQRVGSHRWTTDDIVTAWVASTQQHTRQDKKVKYLDLGTGNASVLQMVTWALLRDGCQVDATGVEARSEAVGLARRSLLFNLGIRASTSATHLPPVAHIVHGDFRDAPLQLNHYDLVTGTPPYFRVDFTVNQTHDTVSQAIIQQGGMPTSKQSAPARCEFRGGIEAYCAVAAKVLVKDSGRFVVCENWLNHDRVLSAAKECRLSILQQVNIMGREGKDTLFCVYVMKCVCIPESETRHEVVVQNLVVRTVTGDWTKDYKESVLSGMSIPF